MAYIMKKSNEIKIRHVGSDAKDDFDSDEERIEALRKFVRETKVLEIALNKKFPNYSLIEEYVTKHPELTVKVIDNETCKFKTEDKTSFLLFLEFIAQQLTEN
jgi:hypothetical protein